MKPRIYRGSTRMIADQIIAKAAETAKTYEPQRTQRNIRMLVDCQTHLLRFLLSSVFQRFWAFTLERSFGKSLARWQLSDRFYLCSSVVRFLLLCLAASYNKIDAAMPALSDSTRGECGIVTNSSAIARISAGTPAPSLPTTIIAAPVKSASCSGLPLCDEVASTRTPCSFRADMLSPSFTRMSGSLNNDPAEPRTALELKWLTVFSPSKTARAPNASAERMIVPRFPGS